MKFSNLVKAYQNENQEEVIFYDKEKDELVRFPSYFLEEILNHKESTKKSDEEQKLFNLIRLKIIDKENFVHFPTIDLLDFIKAKRTFIRLTSRKNRELLKNFKDDYYGVRAFIEKIEKLNLVKKWTQIMDEQVKDSIYTWNTYYNLNAFGNDKKYNFCFKMMEKVAKLAPWKYFSDLDLIKINVGDTNVYVNVLGQSGECFGLVIYYGEEGLRDYEMVQNYARESDSTMAISLQNAIGCYFNAYEELNEKEVEIIDSTKMKFKDGFYPSIVSFKEGLFPSNNINNNTINFVINIFKIIYAGLLDYLNDKFTINFEKGESLEIILHEIDRIELKKWKFTPSNFINNYGLSHEPNSEYFDIDEKARYEVKVDVIERKLVLDENESCWIYILLVMDLSNEIIVYNSEAIYENGQKALTKLADDLKNYALENGFAKEVVTSDIFSHHVALEALGERVEIVDDESCESMSTIFKIFGNTEDKYLEDEAYEEDGEEYEEEYEEDFDVSRMN